MFQVTRFDWPFIILNPNLSRTRIRILVPTTTLTLALPQPFSGTRISFIAFTNSSYNKLLPTVSSKLKELGFTAGSSDGVDLPYFKAFRIDKKELDGQDLQARARTIHTHLNLDAFIAKIVVT